MDIVQELYTFIKEKRKEKKISQKTMGEVLEMTQGGYNAIETGRNKLSIDDFFKIIEYLGFNPFEEIAKKYFLSNEPKQEEKKETQMINIDASHIIKAMLLIAENQQQNNEDVKEIKNQLNQIFEKLNLNK